MTTLLRPLANDDYAVIDGTEPVGRIRLASERNGCVWVWNVTVCIPGAAGGEAPGLEEAKAAFRKSWLQFKAQVGAERLAAAFELAEAARERGTKANRPA